MITDVQVILQHTKPPLLAYVNFILDGMFLVHGARLIEDKGRRFVSMPNEPRTYRCPACRGKVLHSSKFCSHCGLPTPPTMFEGRHQLRDVIHPISQQARDALEQRVFKAYNELMDTRGNQ